MTDLKTKFMGIEIKNPVIIGASNLTSDLESLVKLEEHGAAAVVFKSLFEEQIELENLELQESMAEYNDRHAEMTTLFPKIELGGPEEHLEKLKNAKKKLSIPVIASLNAIYEDTWLTYSKLIAETGVDAIELNFYAVPRKFDMNASEIISQQVSIFEKVKKSLSIPVAAKLSPFYSNPLNVIKQMDDKGADGFVLFNNLYQPDIDIMDETLIYPYLLSNQADNRLPLRFAALLYKNIQAGICSNTGIYSGRDVVKMLLAGADCVQVVSSVYRNGMSQIGAMLTEITDWMKMKNYKSIDDFKGKLAKINLKDPFAFRRAQYIDIMMKQSDFYKKSLIV